MERLSTFVSSRGLLKSCPVRNEQPISSHALIDDTLLERHRANDAIYVCTDALENFSRNFLPEIEAPFVLVSGDSDRAISDSFLSEPALQRLLEDPRLLHWYAQNLAAQHEKLHPLPIGLDYHTMWERPGTWGITAVSPIAQENSLLNILAASPEFSQRYLSAYCNWHFAIHRGDRQECFDRCEKTSCFFEANAIPRNSSWMRQAECMFVASPEGAGMDCHRTWEALLLGCIPVVKRNPLADLFSGLPVLILEDWQELTRERMHAFATETYGKKFDFSPLFRSYWVEKISGIGNLLQLKPMTLSEFRGFLTRKTG